MRHAWYWAAVMQKCVLGLDQILVGSPLWWRVNGINKQVSVYQDAGPKVFLTLLLLSTIACECQLSYGSDIMKGAGLQYKLKTYLLQGPFEQHLTTQCSFFCNLTTLLQTLLSKMVRYKTLRRLPTRLWEWLYMQKLHMVNTNKPVVDDSSTCSLLRVSPDP